MIRQRRRRDRRAIQRAAEVLESRHTPSAVLNPSIGGLNSVVTDSRGIASASAKGLKTTYSYSVTGNAADIAVSPTSGGLALVGGGTDINSVFSWMGAKSNAGDFVVIRATGTNAYNSYIDGLVPSLDSVATLVIPSVSAANDPFVATTIRNAEGIFIAGGDQADYINFWKNTGVEAALYDALLRHVPIGGTSAGLAVLGEIDFSAVGGSVTSSEALANPTSSRVTLDAGFLTPADSTSTGTPLSGTTLQLLNDVVTDSHFQQRDRMGRLVTFLARMDADNLVPGLPRGIAVNEQTALLVEESGNATVVGNVYSRKLAVSEQQRNVYLLSGTTTPAIAPGFPLNYTGVQVQLANFNPVTGVGDTFNLTTWTGSGIDLYSISATAGVLSSTSGSIYSGAAATAAVTAIATNEAILPLKSRPIQSTANLISPPPLVVPTPPSAFANAAPNVILSITAKSSVPGTPVIPVSGIHLLTASDWGKILTGLATV